MQAGGRRDGQKKGRYYKLIVAVHSSSEGAYELLLGILQSNVGFSM
jgi:hypothetical protein